MRREWRALLGAVGVALCGYGCAHAGPIGEPLPVAVPPPPASEGFVRAGVLRGLSAHEFVIDGEEPGAVVATLSRAGVWLRLRVRYTADQYAIEYAESRGLNAQEGDDGVRRIDERYHRYVAALRREIDYALETLPRTAAPSLAEQAPLPPATYGEAAGPSGAAGPGADLGAPTGPGATTGYGATGDGNTAGGAAPPSWASPPSPSPRTAPRPTRPLWEAFIPGVALLGASWIANFSAALAVGAQDELLGFSFFPVVGPWAQLPFLQWSTVPRWMGIFEPTIGFAQLAGLILLVVGAAVHIPASDPPATQVSAPGWMVLPGATPDGAGGALSLDVWF